MTMTLNPGNRPVANGALDAARQRGVTLIEGLLFIVLALSFVISGIVLFQNAQLSNRVTETTRGLVSISSEVRAIHQNSDSFGTESLDSLLLDAGAVPNNFIDGTNIRHLFNNGALEVTGVSQQFTITLQDVPQAACIRLSVANANGQGPAGTGVASVAINGNPPALPVTPTSAQSNCDNTGTNDNNDIVFTYDR